MSTKNREFIVETILLNNRLKRYAEYIQLAQKSGYQVLTMKDFYNLKDRRGTGRHFILRHDVDWQGVSPRKMFEVERSLDVKSTYYFRFITIDVDLIHEMVEAGFEVGLHFETIADYARENGCSDKSEINIDDMRLRLKNDIEKFEEITGCTISSICAHGAPENRELGIPNNALTEDYDVSRLGIQFEAYNKELYDDVDCHVTDSKILFNSGFSYVDTPQSAISEQKQNIVFLSHPNHWYLTSKWRIKYMRAFVRGKAVYSTTKTFKRIAK